MNTVRVHANFDRISFFVVRIAKGSVTKPDWVSYATERLENGQHATTVTIYAATVPILRTMPP